MSKSTVLFKEILTYGAQCPEVSIYKEILIYDAIMYLYLYSLLTDKLSNNFL